MKKYIIIFIVAVIVLFGLVIVQYLKFNDGKLNLIFCDVGQGDAIFIRTPDNFDILIDGGPDKKVLDCLSDNMPFWDRELDAVVLTHPDADHMTGLIHVFDAYSVKNYYETVEREGSDVYDLLKLKIAEENLSASKLGKGGKFKDSLGFELSFLSPRLKKINEIEQNRSKINLNDLSLVGLIKFGNFSALLTADAELNVLSIIKNELEDVSLIKVPHHGSSGGLNDEILNILKPEVGIIMVGENNKFGHPTKETINILEKNKVKIFRTDIDGEIRVKSDGKRYQIN